MGKNRSSDIFYLVKIPGYNISLRGAPHREWKGGLFFGSWEPVESKKITIHHPEKKLWFDTKKAAKRYCLENDIPIESIIKIEV